MKAILVREIKSFFGSVTGYLVIAVFLLLSGLFLWVFNGEYNILNGGYNDLSPFFVLAPWILIFLIPAVCMRSFSEEKRQGTLELLLTKPVSLWEITLGKFFGAFFLIVIAIIPTFIYIWVLNGLGYPPGNIDWGSTLGSYFGLLFLIAAYTSIGIFASTLSDNQIVSFIISVFLCFVFYFGFEGIAQIFPTYSELIASIGMENHFRSMSRGVIDTRDILYFLSITFLFLTVTTLRLKSVKNAETRLKGNYIYALALIAVLFVINVASDSFFKRFDLTQDKRYTLSQASLDILKNIESPLFVDVFLHGKFPGDIRRLQVETKQLLEEFKAYNSNIQYQFVNPVEEVENPESVVEAFYEKGLIPIQVTIEEKGKQSQEMVFPWAVAYSEDKDSKVQLLKNMMGATTEEKVISSVQHLEYAFSSAFQTITREKQKKVAVLKGNGQPQDVYIGDALLSIREKYFIAPFTLDSVVTNPQKTLEKLSEYDLALMVKPSEPFTDEEKLVLDQYIMQGGKMLWMLDVVSVEMDSLYAEGKTLAFPRDLQLQDMFFKYGFRINPGLIKDIMATPISLATGEGSASQFSQYPWFYSPLIYPESKHPIVNNIEGLKFNFTNPIDTLRNNINKTVLLKSSHYSKTIGTPVEVELAMVTEKPEPIEFENMGNIPVAVLLEGAFGSAFQNRVLPFKPKTVLEESVETRMIVISDGDIMLNQIDRDFQPLELGFDKWTNQYYGNKEFILNCVNYLLDDGKLINIRSKEVRLPLLDKEKVYEKYTVSQILTVGLPLLLLAVFGVFFVLLRKHLYAK